MSYDGDKPITEQEGVMFAATPAWERGKKRRGLVSKKAARAAPAVTVAPEVAPEPRSFATAREAEARTAPNADRIDQTTAYAMGAAAAAPTIGETLDAEDAGLVAPIHRPSARKTRSATSGGVSPAAIAAGAVAVVVAGGIGFYAMRGGDSGIPELTPGAATSEVAVAPLEAPPSAPAPGERAQNILPERAAPPSAPAPREVARAEPRAAAPRVRPAAAASAEASGTNASATIPAGPQPYSTLNPANPGAAPTIAPPPVEVAPEPIPSTPPVTSPEPTTTSPTAPETVLPPETTPPT
ncbi:MAG: hypothetical protein JNL41_16600 [Phenylobacterium sp.]|nr:hypothetical protein [Phenylobacterium sp.]